MAMSPRLIVPAAAVVLVAALATGWWALSPADDAAAPDAATEAPPEAVEGDEAGLSDAQAAAAATPVIIDTDQGPMQADGEGDGEVPDGTVDETPLTEATDVDTSVPPGDPITLPSGRQVWWADSAQDTQGPSGLTYRFRFVAPHIDPGMDAGQQQAAHEDMQALCEAFAIPRIARPSVLPQQIVITLMERAVGFGEADAAVTQFFEAFSLTAPEGRDPNDPATPLACHWEVY